MRTPLFEPSEMKKRVGAIREHTRTMHSKCTESTFLIFTGGFISPTMARTYIARHPNSHYTPNERIQYDVLRRSYENINNRAIGNEQGGKGI